ncbi:MAG: cupin-like domain-containing protein [Acetobacteraceae bacterium]
MLHEIEDLTGVPLHEEITWSTLTVFLASPRIVTPYHIDHESNFLFQIEGEKEVCLFDPSDQDLLPAPEIEQFYVGNAEAANYRSHLQDRGTVYRLTPGMAVHHPPLAPHWVKNGDGVSVSASIGFCMRDLDRRAKVHQANLVLRKLGLHPQAPGLSRTGDRAKAAVMSVLSKSNPQTQDDLLFSGIRRAVAPFRALKRLRSRVGRLTGGVRGDSRFGLCGAGECAIKCFQIQDLSNLGDRR